MRVICSAISIAGMVSNLKCFPPVEILLVILKCREQLLRPIWRPVYDSRWESFAQLSPLQEWSRSLKCFLPVEILWVTLKCRDKVIETKRNKMILCRIQSLCNNKGISYLWWCEKCIQVDSKGARFLVRNEFVQLWNSFMLRGQKGWIVKKVL